MLYELRPLVLESQGLEAALEQYAGRFPTNPNDPAVYFSKLGEDEIRRQVLAGGYRLLEMPPEYKQNLVQLVSCGAVLPETLEAAMALRRAIWISYGRGAQAAIRQMALEGKNLDGQWMPTALKGACYSFQPEIHATGHQNAGTAQDFTHRPAALLAELAAGAGGTPRW